MIADLPAAIRRHARRGILLDSNLLLLVVVGRTDRNLIPRHKRTAKFTVIQFDFIDKLLARFDRIVTTPHILTEVSNQAAQIGGPYKSACLSQLQSEIEVLEESIDPSREIANDELFPSIGLTDCGIKLLAKKKHFVLTADMRLYNRLAVMELDVMNFEHLRQEMR